MINKKLKSKRIVTVALAVTTFAAGSTTALAGITTSKATLDAIVTTPGNYAWLGDATTQYNCLAYALLNYGSWVWPWSGNPTSSQVDTYLNGQGFPVARAMDSYDVAAYDIISYGSSSSITHFSRIADINYSNAKWGSLERLQSLGWSPYKSTPYGPAVKKYAKK